MTRKDAVSYIHKFIKKATNEQLRDLICSMFSPRCSIECPLRKLNSCECKLIENDKKVEKN